MHASVIPSRPRSDRRCWRRSWVDVHGTSLALFLGLLYPQTPLMQLSLVFIGNPDIAADAHDVMRAPCGPLPVIPLRHFMLGTDFLAVEQTGIICIAVDGVGPAAQLHLWMSLFQALDKPTCRLNLVGFQPDPIDIPVVSGPPRKSTGPAQDPPECRPCHPTVHCRAQARASGPAGPERYQRRPDLSGSTFHLGQHVFQGSTV